MGDFEKACVSKGVNKRPERGKLVALTWETPVSYDWFKKDTRILFAHFHIFCSNIDRARANDTTGGTDRPATYL
ncbi:hypothetical protein GCM10023155_47070 [Bremerella cremea]